MSGIAYVNLMDYQLQAKRILPEQTWAYFYGAAADGITAEANIGAWREIKLAPRILMDLSNGHAKCSLLGRDYPWPILVAPMAYQRLAHSDGELAMAAAAAVQGAGFVLSTQTSVPMQDVAKEFLAEKDRGPLWFQMYLQDDLKFNRDLIKEVEAAGYEVLVLTVDAPINGTRDFERRAGFVLPEGISAVHLRGLVKTNPPENSQSIFSLMAAHTTNWDDVDWLVSNTKLPVFLKGVTHPDDASMALKHGIRGLIVSNHGGRPLDTVAPTASLLPGIVKAVNGAVPVIVDGGIRRGTDVIKALAMGATAVMVGRPLVYALACNGAYGAAHALKLLKDELEIAMILCGCKTLKDIDQGILFKS